MSGVVFVGGCQVVSPTLTVYCNRCDVEIRTYHHYHCLHCDDFDLCLGCSAHGIYCYNDAHEWTRKVVIGMKRIDVGARLLPMDIRIPHNDTAEFPSLFEPPNPSDTPRDLFEDEHRYIRKINPREILFYTDGSCLGNGQRISQGGCAFVYRSSAFSHDGNLTHNGTISFALEERGPTGTPYKHTSNRAELRAVIAALQFCDWSQDCNAAWRSIVIATDSQYVALGATSWAKKWEANGWRTFDRDLQCDSEVKNQDLWLLLLAETRELFLKGVNVSFWRIPRELNERADQQARRIANNTGRQEFGVIFSTGPASIATKPWQS